MATEKNLVLQARELLFAKGQKGLDLARQIMLHEKIPYQPLEEVVQYFMASWEDVLHPALLSLSCEAVGGNPDATTKVAAALVLLAGAADLHDDIIDGSLVKDFKPTVFGKFGKDLTVLSGEILLFTGLYKLHEACDPLPIEQKQAILELIKHAFFGITSGEAKETSLRGRVDIAREYLEMIKMKSTITEATMKIGAILGRGTLEEVDALGYYGKTFSLLYTFRDEFIDIFEPAEIKNRVQNECLPLPILLTCKNQEKAKAISKLITGEITEDKLEQILDIVLDSTETNGLKKEMYSMVKDQDLNLQSIKFQKNSLKLLLNSLIEDI